VVEPEPLRAEGKLARPDQEVIQASVPVKRQVEGAGPFRGPLAG
jgi:hypothetical protein